MYIIFNEGGGGGGGGGERERENLQVRQTKELGLQRFGPNIHYATYGFSNRLTRLSSVSISSEAVGLW